MLSIRRFIVVFCIGIFPAVSAGQIYHCKDAQGGMSFQSIPCDEETIKVEENTALKNNMSRPQPKAPINKQGCDEQVQKVLKQILKEINDYYDKRTKRCRKDYASGTLQRRNCIQEQENIKTEKIEKQYRPRAIVCK